MKSIRRIQAIALRQLYLMRGSLSRVLPLFTWVAIDMVLWGYITRYLHDVAGSKQVFAVLLAAVLLWDFFTRVMQGVTMAFFEDVWSRNFLNVFASPITITEYLTGLIFCSVLSSWIGLCVMLAIATGIFGMPFAIYGSLALPFLLILFLFGVALGIVSCAMVLRFGPAAEWFIWPIPAILSPFVGVFYPLSTLPSWMQKISACLPPSYVFESLRIIQTTQTLPLDSLIKGSVLVLLLVGGAFFFFTRMYRTATRLGLIARYSAETVA